MRNRRYGCGAACVNGQIYLVGGSSDGLSSTDSVECFDTKLEKWKMCQPLTTSRLGPAVVALGGCVYVMGGSTQAEEGIKHLCTVEMMDASGMWVPVASMHSVRSSASAVAVGGLIYVFGGFDGSQRAESVERYDPVSDTWEFIAAMTEKRGAHSAAALSI